MALSTQVLITFIAAIVYVSNGLQCTAQCEYDDVSRYANCKSRGLNCIPSNYPQADIMDLRFNTIETISRRDFTGLQNVRVLYLDDNRITGTLEPFIFFLMDNIEVISLRNNHGGIGPFDFHRPKLGSVFLDNNQINDAGVNEFFSDAIEYLSLDYNIIENFDFSDIFFETLRH